MPNTQTIRILYANGDMLCTRGRIIEICFGSLVYCTEDGLVRVSSDVQRVWQGRI